MPLDPDQKRRYVRHLLLPDIGEAGQSRLCAMRARVVDGGDADAAAVAQDYLTRAGVTFDDAGTRRVEVADAARVMQCAGAAHLRSAAAALAGAFAAVEAIKATVGAGRPATWPVDLVLTEDPS